MSVESRSAATGVVKGLLRYVLSAAVVARAFLLAPFSARQRAWIALIARNSRVGALLGDHPADLPCTIPWVDARSLTPLVDRVTVPVVAATWGNVSSLELIVLGALARETAVRRIFEIGTFNGLTSLTMALNAAADAVIHTLDLPPDKTVQPSLPIYGDDSKAMDLAEKGGLLKEGRYPEAAKVTQWFGDSATFDYEPFAGTMDMVFVDGSHSYEYIKSDTAAAFRLLRPEGGTIVWHDLRQGWPGVVRFLEELYHTPRGRGLVRVTDTTLAVLRTARKGGM